MYSVYMYISPSGKRYIGITSQKPKSRWNNGKGYKSEYHFGMAIKKYGWDKFTHEILFENLTEDEAKAKEIELIAFFDTTNPKLGYNVTKGGDSVSGHTQNAETRQKISQAHKGKTLSNEHRENISKGNKGVSRHGCGKPKGFKESPDTLKKKSESHKNQIPWNKGRKAAPISEETRQKLRDASLRYWEKQRCQSQ